MVVLTPLVRRHVGMSEADIGHMLRVVGCADLAALVLRVVPSNISTATPPQIRPLPTKPKAAMANAGIGRGYYGTQMPSAIRRLVLDSPAWYTPYTPYQAEISQGRLEVLFWFQTLVAALSGLPVANAGLLDEGTAVAEAISMLREGDRSVSVSIDAKCWPQTIAVVRTRHPEASVGLDGDIVVVQYPDSDGILRDWSHLGHRRLVVAADPMALLMAKSPGEMGASVACGSMQRFGMPMGCGGPHAAFIACKDELKRRLPGRIVGLTRDRLDRPAYRLALQAREQHIRRGKATSNICTAQALPAVISTFYAIYHGAEGLHRIAQGIHEQARALAERVECKDGPFFDTLCMPDGRTLSLDETAVEIPGDLPRRAAPLRYTPLKSRELHLPEVFTNFTTEVAFQRLVTRLARKDYSLLDTSIPLGSCTMKLSPSEVVGLDCDGHPLDRNEHIESVAANLRAHLCSITGMHACSLQPNSGAQGEYAGLLAIRALNARRVVLVPESAHGTNPASAAMAGFAVVPIRCGRDGLVDMPHLRQRLSPDVAALMITVPSTFGVFDEELPAIIDAVHAAGAQVYVDGANMNACIGTVRPFGSLGVDAMHLNLHKTFCIPHGGGGPGVGPLLVREHLRRFLPEHIGPVASAPLGSASLLEIPLRYIEAMGGEGLQTASRVAILSANYLRRLLADIGYTTRREWCAHEFIVDLKPLLRGTPLKAADVARRLGDYGVHAPTLSWPLPESLMFEPTESEPLSELHRLARAMEGIYAEIKAGQYGLLQNAPHPIHELSQWTHAYSPSEAMLPVPEKCIWPSTARIDDTHGDANFCCTVPK